jgi:hypothetical protein
MVCKCVNQGGVPVPVQVGSEQKGCLKTTLFGREGIRLMEHVVSCDYTIVNCSDCKEVMSRRDYLLHRPDTGSPCPRMPLLCAACQVKVPRSEIDQHYHSTQHLEQVTKRASALVGDVATLQSIVTTLNQQLETTNKLQHAVKQQQLASVRDYEHKINELGQRYELKLDEIRSSATAVFCEFEIPKWSEVKEPALFSTGSALRVPEWRQEFWLKVEPGVDHIGLYLCCWEDGLFPFVVDYQLMVRKRGSDEGVCASIIMRTTFTLKEKAWGLAQFTSLAALTREGAYRKDEDKITFGCLIYPINGLMWGRGVSRLPARPRG